MTASLLLLLTVFLCMGSTDRIIQRVEYGNDFNIRFRSQPESVEFIPKNSSTLVVIWKEGAIRIPVDVKYRVTDTRFTNYKVTQNDSGDYLVKYKDSQDISTYPLDVKAGAKLYKRKHGDSLRVLSSLQAKYCNINFFPETSQSMYQVVREGRLQGGMAHLGCSEFDMLDPCGILIEKLQLSCFGRYEFRDKNANLALRASVKLVGTTRTYRQKVGSAFSFSLNLEPKSCNIYFTPKSDSGRKLELTLVQEGMLLPGLRKYDCTGFEMGNPCGISNKYLKMPCSGLYEIRDQNGSMILAASLEMLKPSVQSQKPTYIGVGTSGAIAAFLCACIKYCCCGKSCCSEDRSEAAAEPDDNQEHDVELNGLRPEVSQQPGTEIHHQPYTDMPPSYNQIRSHPDTDVLPSYNQVSAPAVSAQGPSVAVPSGPQGTAFSSAPPLTSTDSYTFTSERYNFL